LFIDVVKQRLSADFLMLTVNRKEEIFQALFFFHFPHIFSTSDRLAILVMLGCPGIGKTHMVDEIVRAQPDILEWKEKQLNDENSLLEEKADEISTGQKEENDLMLKAIGIMRKRFNNIFFVPFSLNSHVTPFKAENAHRIPAMIVSRLLYCYFCVSIDFETFRMHFDELITKISVKTAFDVIRYDQSLFDPEDPNVEPKPFESSRGVLLVDEVSKIVCKHGYTTFEDFSRASALFYHVLKTELFQSMFPILSSLFSS
jgi:hypothetical protein